MTYDVTSWFIDQTLLKTVKPLRVFKIGTSDYSGFVTKWPKVKRTWDQPRPVSINIVCANDDQTFNFLREDKTQLTSRATFEFGYNHVSSGDELITIFAGTIHALNFSKGLTTLTVADKMQAMSNRLMGTRETPLDFTGSDHLMSDLAWYAMTSHGGFSAVESSSNPDIDYDEFATWAGIMSGDNIRGQAYLSGIKVTEFLRKISRMTRSAIFMEEDRMVITRFDVVATPTIDLDAGNTIAGTLKIESDDINNRQYVSFAYDVNSKEFASTVVNADSASINSYGLHEEVEEDKHLWYVDSASALNLAQRIILINGEPNDQLTVTAPLSVLTQQLGDVVTYTNSLQSVFDNYRIMQHTIDFDKATIKMEIDKTQIFNAFILDVTSLDGSEVLT